MFLVASLLVSLVVTAHVKLSREQKEARCLTLKQLLLSALEKMMRLIPNTD